MNEQCKHRWEPSEFGKRWWEPGTYQHICRRCGEMRMCRIEVPNAKDMDERISGSEPNATA